MAATSVYLMPLNWTLNMVKTENFMLCTSHHNFKQGKYGFFKKNGISLKLVKRLSFSLFHRPDTAPKSKVTFFGT